MPESSPHSLNDDKKVLEGRRVHKLGTEAEVDLRDQIPEKLRKHLVKENIGQKVVEMWLQANDDRQDWLDRQQVFLADVDNFTESTSEGAFSGASTLHIPMPLTVAKTMHARFLRAAVGIEPLMNTKARREDALKAADLVQDVMQYTLKDWCNRYNGIYKTMDRWIWDWLTIGSGIIKWRWDVEWSSWWDAEDYVNADEDGNTIIEQREVKRTEKVYEGPCADVINHEDFAMVGGDGDPQMADCCLERCFLTASQLWTAVDRKFFNEQAVRKVIRGGEDRKEGSRASEIKRQRVRQGGQAQVETEKELDRYEFIEAHIKMDVDGSGLNSDVVVWVHTRTYEVVRATYLRRINKAGQRPFYKIDFHPRPGSDYGIGLLEMLHPLSKELDALHNIHVDNNLITTMPFGFFRPTGNMTEQIYDLEPGCLYPVDDPQRDVFFPNLGNRMAFGIQQEQSIQTMVERLTGINDLSLGVLSGAQGATRTATGARALLQEQSTSLDVYLRRFQWGWSGALAHLLHMLQQRIPEGLSFRVTGKTGDDYWGRIDMREQIGGEYDFELNANSESSNPEIQKEVALQVLQFTLNPLLIQTQVVTTGNIWDAAKNYMTSLGVKDFARFITKPQEYRHTMTPEQEANRILRGQPVPVTPEMDHEGFIEWFDMFSKSDEYAGQLSREAFVALGMQARKHRQMAQALQEAQAQAANQRQAQLNARDAGQQAPVGASAVGGNPGAGPQF